jgi:hypothetical protein
MFLLPSFIPSLLSIQNEQKVFQFGKTKLFPHYFPRIIFLKRNMDLNRRVRIRIRIRSDPVFRSALLMGIRIQKEEYQLKKKEKIKNRQCTYR